MQAQLNALIPGQVIPKDRHKNHRRNTGIDFIINGCTVSFTSNTNGTDESLTAVKEILLSAYRTRMTKG